MFHQINKKVFEQFPVLTTKRLTLRDIRITDAEEVYKMRSNGRVNEFIARKKMNHLDDSVKLIEKTIQAYKNCHSIGWAGVLRDKNEIIGTCGFNSIDTSNMRAEIGGELSTDYWGKHVAIEAVCAIVKFGLDDMNLHSIEAKVNPKNKGAIYLLESIGFSKEAHFQDRIYYDGAFNDMAVYSLIRGNEIYP